METERLNLYFNPHEREARDSAIVEPTISQIILIHTSVKLVTCYCRVRVNGYSILIHTSVKLVTELHESVARSHLYFNPHEREARD